MPINVMLPDKGLRMVHKDDPAKVIWDKLKEGGGIDDVALYHNNILVAVYQRPEKTAGGIIITEKARGEDVFTGVVGLVIKKGPLAFKSDEQVDFAGQDVEIGQWVWFRPQDSTLVLVKGVKARMLKEFAIMGTVAHPDDVL